MSSNDVNEFQQFDNGGEFTSNVWQDFMARHHQAHRTYTSSAIMYTIGIVGSQWEHGLPDYYQFSSVIYRANFCFLPYIPLYHSCSLAEGLHLATDWTWMKAADFPLIGWTVVPTG